MFRVNPGFVRGYNYAQIADARIAQIKGYAAIALDLVNEYGVQNTFLVFLNNTYLINQLLSIVYHSFSFDEELDEKDLVGTKLYVYLEPQVNYFKITRFQECNDDAS